LSPQTYNEFNKKFRGKNSFKRNCNFYRVASYYMKNKLEVIKTLL